MSKVESYQALATLMEYPQEREAMLASLGSVAAYLDDRGLVSPVSPFAGFVRGSTLAELQEDYVATFDFDPSRAPYLGHHLYGDHQRKSEYMISLKQEFARFGFAPESCELPDHLSVILGFLAHLARQGEEETRHRFIGQAVLPGLKKLTVSERSASPWLPLLQAAELLLMCDCQEVTPC